MGDTGMFLALGTLSPTVAPSAWVAPGAVLIGDVTMGERSSVWYGAVVRGDDDRVAIGAGSNVQDGCVLHADPELPVKVGEDVSIGHRAVVHGCTIGDGSLIGIGAVVLNGADIGPGCLVAAGAVVSGGTRVPAGSLVVGTPGRIRRSLSVQERTDLRNHAVAYAQLAATHAAAKSPAIRP